MAKIKTESTILYKNLEYLRKTFRLSKDEFCPIAGFSRNTYDNFKDGKPYQDSTIEAIINSTLITELFYSVEEFKNAFKNGLTCDDLVNVDIEKAVTEPGSTTQSFYPEKFDGLYMCYYNSTNIEGKKFKQYGLMAFQQVQNSSEFDVKGIFSFKDADAAQALYATIAKDIAKAPTAKYKKGVDAIFNERKKTDIVFTGKAYLTTTLLWCTLSNEQHTEHVSVSFDLDSKVVTKNQKAFIGARGIALSQTSGLGFKTVTFPMVMVKTDHLINANKLARFLGFGFGKLNDNSLYDIAASLYEIDDSLVANGHIQLTPEERKAISAAVLDKKIRAYLAKDVFSSQYYTVEELDDFYATILRPLREALKRDETK